MLILIVGKTASGKNTLLNEIRTSMSANTLVSCTSRKKRPGEKEGIDYFFKTSEQFKNLIANNKFSEFTYFSGNLNYYGTLKSELKKCAQGHELFVHIVEPEGLKALKKELGEDNIFSIFVDANLGTRITRYIQRQQQDISEFNLNDAQTLFTRLKKEESFSPIAKEVDMVVDTSNGIPVNCIKSIEEAIDSKLIKTTIRFCNQSTIEEIER